MGLGNQSRPYRAKFDEATAATHVVVAAVTNKRIVVTNLVCIIGSSQTAIWKSGTTAISGVLPESYTTGDNELGILETERGEALQLTLSAAVQVTGHLTYVLMP